MRASRILLTLVGGLAASTAHPADMSIARQVASGCSACHGTNGVSLGVTPSLAGAAKADIVTKMQAFKRGERPGTVMPQLAKGYTDEQIELAAEWFSNQPAPNR